MSVRCILLATFSLFIVLPAVSQSEGTREKSSRPLGIRDQIPDAVWRTLPKKAGARLIILDFWSTYCLSCMEAFPKMERLQRQFPESLDLILVNSWENAANMRSRMNTINKNRQGGELPLLSLPALTSLVNDTILKALFPVQTIPHHVWLDATGIVLHITYGYNATAGHVQDILDGKPLSLNFKDDTQKENFKNGYLKPVVKEMPPVYYSAFIPYYGSGGESLRIDSGKATFKIVKRNLSVLYMYEQAFREDAGREPFRILIEPSVQKVCYMPPSDPDLLDHWHRSQCFTYEMQGRLADKGVWKKKMQTDLNQFFGNLFGIEGVLEKREFRCLVLKVTDIEIFRKAAQNRRDLQFPRKPFFLWVNEIKDSLENVQEGICFFDETGIDRRTDMSFLSGVWKTKEELRKHLRNNGLDIVDDERNIQVLVIKEKTK